jgi:hypothetical protein
MLCKEVLHCTDTIPKIVEKIFPERKLRGLSPNIYMYIFVSDFYISTMGLSVWLQQKIGETILGIYKTLSLTDV